MARSILQWNVNGLRLRSKELRSIITNYNTYALALQETHTDEDLRIPQFTTFFKHDTGHRRGTWGGVALAIRDGYPHRQISLQTTLTAIAVQVDFPVPLTLVSLYLPRGTRDKQTLINLYQQIPKPFLVLGDFNSHHSSWGSNKTLPGGQTVLDSIDHERLVILNDGTHTHLTFSTGCTDAIDISLSSNDLGSRFTWEVLPDTHDSDHFPILIRVENTDQTLRCRKKWKLDQADWTAFEDHITDNLRPGMLADINTITKAIHSAAEEAIPRTSGKVHPKSVPWWNNELKAATRQRKKTLRRLRKLPNDHPDKPQRLEEFHKARSTARRLTWHSSKKSWGEFVESINPQTPTTTLWKKVRALRGDNRYHRTPCIEIGNQLVTEPKEVADALADRYQKASSDFTQM